MKQNLPEMPSVNPRNCLFTGNEFLFFLLIGVCSCLLVSAQQSSHPEIRQDSLEVSDTMHKGADIGFVDRIQHIADSGYLKSKADYYETKETYHREAIIDQIIQTIQDAKQYLGSGLDTAEIARNISEIEKDMEIASDGIFADKGMSQTYRNLTTSSLVIRELLTRTLALQAELELYKTDLAVFKLTYDSLNADSLIYQFPKDSVGLMKHVGNLSSVLNEIEPADSMLKASLASVETFQTPVFVTVSKLRTRMELIQKYQEDLSRHLLRRENYNLWAGLRNTRPIQDIARSSAAKGWLVLHYYVENHLGKIALLCMLIGLTTIFFRNLRQRQEKASTLHAEQNSQLVLNFPFPSALVIIISIFQFMFIDPPFLFSTILWLISSVALTIIFWRFIVRYWMIMWIIMLTAFSLACADNLLLQSSRPERYGMFVVSLLGCSVGLFYLNGKRFNELREPNIIYFIRFMVLLEFLSLAANLFGRYNISKSLFIAGFANVVIGILFLWTIRLMNEALFLASKTYTRPEKRHFYINFEKIGNKTPYWFYVLLVLGWIGVVGSNFYAYKQLTTPLRNFLLSERTIGSYTFSVESLLVFLIIMTMAMLLSKVISYFASDVHYSESVDFESSKTKVGLGSWLLLVRIFIISLGLFLAFAATGIPMDRFIIILGALGVGIGLGLQSLVNNLVSGLIIAFEKPVNVGDIVELEGKHGVMKSIGFRSSVIVRVDGAQVVIPNGDLISQQLVNWSMGKGKRRMEVLVGVAYGTDLEKTKKLLMEVLQKSDKVLAIPPPMVLAQDFKESAIEFRCNFWVGNFNEWVLAKSEIIRTIDHVFRTNGIVIPFPQRDLYIKQIPEEKELAPDGEDSAQIKGNK